MKPFARPAAMALALGAIAAFAIPALIFPAPAFAQNVSCTACTHEVSYFKGKGGLIAKAAKNAEGETATEVTWVAQCGGVVRSGKLMANDDGIVSTLFDDDNNLACSTDDGRFRLGPVTDGGWFWITDDDNSAVGNLVNKNVLGNVTTTLANAGAGVETAAGRGVTFVKETATGRVGILPNILPVAPTSPTRKCGFSGKPDPGHVNGNAALRAGDSVTGKTRINSNCKLGDGKTVIRFYGPFGIGGSDGFLEGNTIVRPYTGGSNGVTRFWGMLYGNGSGHFTTANPAASSVGDPDLGHFGGNSLFWGTGPFGASSRPWKVTVAGATPGSVVDVGRGAGGCLGRDIGTGLNEARYGFCQHERWSGEFVLGKAGTGGAYCGTPTNPKNFPLTFTLEAYVGTGSSGVDQVAPPVAVDAQRKAAETTLRVVCPSSPEAQELRRQGLVPESLFRGE